MVAAGRRRFFYVYHLASGRVERVARIQGMDEERSLETFAASPAQELPELAFLGNGARKSPVELLTECDGWLMLRGLSCAGSATVLASVPGAQASSALIPDVLNLRFAAWRAWRLRSAALPCR